MMVVFNYLFFSMLEGFAILTLMLTLFRFNPRYYLIPILVVSVVTSVTSYLFRVHWAMEYLDPFAYLVIVIIGIIWMLEVRILFAVLISISGYMGFAFIQTLILLFLILIGVLKFEDLQTTSHFQGILLVICTSLAVLLLSWFIFKKGWGFTFSFKKIKNIREITIFVSIIIMAITVIAIILFCIYQKTDNILIFLVLSLSSLAVLLYYAFHKEKRND